MARKRRRARSKERYFDRTLLFIIIFFLCFGLLMIYSVSSYEAQVENGSSVFYLKKQLSATILGVFCLIITIIIDYHFWARFANIAYVVAAILILLVLTPLGIEVNGAKRWLNVFGVSLQPAEVAKVAMILFFANFICYLGKRIRQPKAIFMTIGLSIPIVLMVIGITNNLSSAIIIFGIVILMIFVSTPEYARFFIIAAIGLSAAGLVVLAVSKGWIPDEISFRLTRIKAWLHPEDYPDTTAFQTLQALYAIGSGGIFGKGLGQSMQKLGFLPEAQNDMIFSIICEELGLFGALGIICLFMLMIWRFMVIANNAPDLFGSLVVVGVMGHIAIQVILNIAVVTNTIPNTGITLPFISYGGSSIMFLLIEMGLVLNVSRSIRLER